MAPPLAFHYNNEEGFPRDVYCTNGNALSLNSATPPSMLAASNALLFIAFEVRRREKHFFF